MEVLLTEWAQHHLRDRFLGNSERSAKSNSGNLTGVHHAVNGHRGDAHHLSHLSDGEEVHVRKGVIHPAGT